MLSSIKSATDLASLSDEDLLDCYTLLAKISECDPSVPSAEKIVLETAGVTKDALAAQLLARMAARSNSSLTQARVVSQQIAAHYSGGYINYSDLAVHLKNGRIDSFEPIAFKPVGYDSPYGDSYPMVVYFQDKSLLIVTGYGTSTAQESF